MIIEKTLNGKYYRGRFYMCIKCGEYRLKDKCGCNIYFKHRWYKEQKRWLEIVEDLSQ